MFNVCKNEVVKIQYDKGNMVINLNAFFPNTKCKIDKLWKVIIQDTEHKEEIINKIKSWLEYAIQETEEQLQFSKETYENVAEKVENLQKSIKNKEKCDDFVLSKEGLKNAKKELRGYKEELSDWKDSIKFYTKNFEKFTLNLVQIEGLVLLNDKN